MKNKLLPVIPMVIAFAIIGYLSVTSTEYMSVSELNFEKPTRVVVMGNVSKGSVHYKDHLEFRITDGNNEVRVIYPGWVKLDNVSGYGTVVVEGIYYPNGTIFANKITSKCPSKEVIDAYNTSLRESQ
jgi:cytochrome c-type biogenesis protein CcmE